MSNVKKGNEFETRSLEIIENLKERGLFGVKEFLNVKAKAKYYSELRKGEIEFDLVIEFTPPGSDKPMMTYFIECKNYDKRVPVEQVQKFHSDILQVSGVNCKGIMISNGPFQKSAYNFAKSTGMMVVEGESVENFKIVHYKRSLEYESNIPFIKASLKENLINDGLKSMEKLIDIEILNVLTESNSDISFNIDKLSKKDIDAIAIKELNRISQDYLKNANGLSVQELGEYLKRKYAISIDYFAPQEDKLLGTCDIDSKSIGISKRIVGTSRELFVLAHEFGHWILHQKLFINQELMNSFSDSKHDFSIGKNRLENPRHWVEWQANYFSASIILPKTSIVAKAWQYSNSRDTLIFDDNQSNQRKFRRIIKKLANHFNVSQTSIIYRLKELHMISDNTRTKSIGELISQWKSQFFT